LKAALISASSLLIVAFVGGFLLRDHQNVGGKAAEEAAEGDG
jgi:hypothetical protein